VSTATAVTGGLSGQVRVTKVLVGQELVSRLTLVTSVVYGAVVVGGTSRIAGAIALQQTEMTCWGYSKHEKIIEQRPLFILRKTRRVCMNHVEQLTVKLHLLTWLCSLCCGVTSDGARLENVKLSIGGRGCSLHLGGRVGISAWSLRNQDGRVVFCD
jgi:hypothetical protein